MAKEKTIPEILDEAVSAHRGQLVGVLNACFPLMVKEEKHASREKLRQEFEKIVARLQKEVIKLQSKLNAKAEEKI